MGVRKARTHAALFAFFALAFIFTVVAPAPFAASGEAKAAYPLPEETRIRELIYPTLGNPAIVRKGDTLEVEWDFRDGDPDAPLPDTVEGWSACLSTGFSPCPVRRDLITGTATLGPSSHWEVFYREPDYGLDAPEAPGAGALGYDVYRVSFTVPPDTPVDLYDLTVSVTADGYEVTRTTDNSVKVVDAYKDDYWFAVIADAHTNDSRGSQKTYRGNPEVMEHRSFLKAQDIMNMLDLEYVLVAGDTCMGVPNTDYSVHIPKAGSKSEVDIYKYEYNQAYQKFSRFEHPVVMAVGNHDGYVTDDGDDDGFRYWQDFFAPLYYGWEYGDKAHVSVINSNDHTYGGWIGGRISTFRNPGLIGTAIYAPTVWYLGKIREVQRNWMASEIADGAASPLSMVLQHHAPATEHKSWQNGFFSGLGGLFPGWPEGEKGLSEELGLLDLYQVDACVHGHDHGDAVGYAEGNDHTLHLNNTTLSLDCMWYPGFRLVHVSGGEIDSFCYYPDPAGNDKWSVPTYAEAQFPVPPVITKEYLSTFQTPLLESYVVERSLLTFPTWAGYDWTRGVTDITRRVVNRFDPASPQTGVLRHSKMTFYMPSPEPGRSYAVEGPYNWYTWVDTEIGGKEYRVFEIDVDLPAGATTEVRVHMDPAPPYLATVEPGAAPVGAEVKLTGAGFGSPGPSSYVSFGGVNATGYSSWSDGEIRAVVPEGFSVDTEVTVTTPDGTSNGVPFSLLSVKSVAPNYTYQYKQSLSLKISGSGFKTGATARLEKGTTVLAASKATVDSAAQMTCTFGFASAAPGVYDVVVANADGGEARLVGGFTVRSYCGTGGGSAGVVLGMTLGLISITGAFCRKRRRRP